MSSVSEITKLHNILFISSIAQKTHASVLPCGGFRSGCN